MKTSLIVPVLAIGAILGLAACQSSTLSSVPATFGPSPSASSPVPSGSFSGTAVPAVATHAPADACAGQVGQWKANGAVSQMSAVATDLQQSAAAAIAVGNDIAAGNDLSNGSSADLATLQSALAMLQSDIQALQANPAPSCVPRLRGDLSAALEDFSTASIEGQQGVTDEESGDYGTAATLLDNSAQALDVGSARIQAATADITSYNGQG